MTVVYEVRPYDNAIARSYPRLFPEQGDDKSPALLDWRFAGNPHGAGHFAVGVDTERNGAIMGMIALIATRLRVGGGTVAAVQAVDTVVDPAYRGQGAFVKLGAAVHAAGATHGGRVAWGFPNANAAPGWFGKLQWRNFGTVPFLFKPLRSGYFLRRLWRGLGAVDLPLAWRRPSQSPSVELVGRFDDGFGALWRDFATGIGCGVERDAAYLNWRLIERPDAAYRNVADRAPDGNLRAFVSSTILDKHDGRICYVMEALSRLADEALLARLIRGEVARAARDGADVALAWCPPDAPNRRAYARAGFFPLPDRLRPVAIHFGARMLDPVVPTAAGEARTWYLSYLDSDTV